MSIKTILILAANPKDTARLRVDEEAREIKEVLVRSKERDQFCIEQREALRIRDLRRALLDVDPQFVHFSGHGEMNGIMLEDEDGNGVIIEPDALASLFTLCSEKMECVILNACYSEQQANAINQNIKYVVGMSKEIGDKAAIEFAVGFYDALFAGKDIDQAYSFGCNAIQLEGIPEHLTPILKSNPDIILPIEQRRIFICYKRNFEPDHSVVSEVTSALKEKGFHVFIDKEMPAGVEWGKQIDEELRNADFFIPFLSEHSIRSEMVKGEVKKAHDLKTERHGCPQILPVRVKYREPFQYPISEFLNPLNWAKWDGPEDTAHLIDQLDQAISGNPLPISSNEKSDFIQLSEKQDFYAPTHSAYPVCLEMPEGAIDPESKFYVERSSDRVAFELIQRQGETITIKGSRHMGKTSLLIRLIKAAKKLKKQVACLDFQLLNKPTLENADTFYHHFCAWLTDELKLENKVDEYWDLNLSNNLRCTRYMERHLLKMVNGPLVLAMDEVESLTLSEFRSDFLGMLRSWHTQRKPDSVWKNLDLVLVTATDPYLYINDLQQSPFNIGAVIELIDFNFEQVTDLNNRHGSPFNPQQLEELMQLLQGHPYLTRQAMYLVASGRMSAENIFAQAIDEQGPFGDHLRYRFFKIYDKNDLIQCLIQILNYQTCQDNNLFYRLQCFGFVKRENGKAVFRCELYRKYFKERLHG